MAKKKVNDLGELKSAVDTTSEMGNFLVPQIDNLIIDFPITLPIHFSRTEWQQKFSGATNDAILFSSCKFLNKVEIQSSHLNFYFEDCDFNQVNAKDKKFEGKIRFRDCNFIGVVDFRNTKFLNLTDFYKSTFYQKTIFYKTDFMDTVVFSAATFKENVLFTYSLIDKLIIFRGTKFKKGFDLSLSIPSGKMGVFDIELNDFKTISKYLDEDDFEEMVSKIGDIPIKNKRETFRILKKYFENNNNIVESLPFKVLEKITLTKENIYALVRTNKKEFEEKRFWKLLKIKVKSVFNLIVLSVNFLSNYFGVAYVQSSIFTLIIGGLFYYITILNTDRYFFDWYFEWSILKENIPAYANYLIPTHKFNFLDGTIFKSAKLSKWFYVFDITGRIAISYGIYQTIQAFRKFR